MSHKTKTHYTIRTIEYGILAISLVLTLLWSLLTNSAYAQISTLQNNCFGTGGISAGLSTFLNSKFVSSWPAQNKCQGDIAVSVVAVGDLLSGNVMKYDVTATNNGPRWSYGSVVTATFNNGLSTSTPTLSYGQMGPGTSQTLSLYVAKGAATPTTPTTATATFTLTDSSITDISTGNNTTTHSPTVRGSSRAVCRASGLTVPTYECEALMDLYASTNGAGWTSKTNWSTSPNIESWFGLTTTINDDLLAYYSFDASNATDDAGNGYNGILTNNPTFGAGNIGSAVQFNGTNRISLGTGVNPGTKITISTWVYRTSTTASQGIVWKNGVYAFAYRNGTLQVAPGNNRTRYNTNIALPLNQWTYVTWTYDGSIMKVYKNGILGWSTTLVGSLPSNSNITYIGYDENGWRRNGSIDDMRIYNRALSAAEITQLYNSNTILENTKSICLSNTVESTACNYQRQGTVGNNMSGPLTGSIGLLSELTTLALSNNALGGTIPTELTNLKKASVVLLASTNLTGGLPTNIGNMAALSQLDIAGNNLGGPIHTGLINTNISTLRASNNKFNYLPDLSARNWGQLQLEDNLLSGPLPAWIGTEAGMTFLRLSKNNFTGPIPSSWNGLTSLNTLWLWDNQLTGSLDVWSGLNVSAWQQLRVENNNLNRDHNNNAIVPANIQARLSSMTSQNLTNQGDITPPVLAGTGVIPQTIDGAFTYNLTVNENSSTTGAGFTNGLTISFTGASICQQALLTTDTILNKNGTTTIQVAALEPVKYEGCQVYITDRAGLQSNRITLPTFTSNEYGICNTVTDITKSDCKALIDLYYSTSGSGWTYKTNWRGVGDSTPTTACDWYGVICSGGRVYRLLLEGSTTTVPDQACDWSNGHPGNNLSGTLVDSIGNLTGLNSLCLPNNKITGPLPSTMANLTNLWAMALWNNPLNTTLPDNRGSLVNVQYLLLNNAGFTGMLPAGWSGMNSIRYLNLHDNSLTGQLPDSRSSIMNTMNTLRLYNNNLNGLLPSGWSTSAARVKSLLLNSNQFSGPLPASWGSFTGITSINIGSNNLQGLIPDSWSALTSLNNNGSLLGNNCLSSSTTYMSSALISTLNAKFGSWTSQKTCPGTIGSRVWTDTNINGLRDSTETGPSGVTVTLRQCSDQTPAYTGYLQNGIVGYYSFDNGITTDDGPWGRIATNSGSVGSTAGKILSAAQFNGTSQYLDTNMTLTPSQGGTVSVWFQGQGQTSSAGSILRPIVMQGDFKSDTSPEALEISMLRGGQASVGQIRFSWGSDDASQIYTTNLDDNTWHHIVMTKVDTQVKGYVDGVLRVQFTESKDINALTNFQIGGSSTSPDRKFKGLIDDVRIYDRALSASEITALYNITAPTTATNIPISYAGTSVSSINSSAGAYSFANINPGRYYLEYSNIPAGYKFTTQNVGGPANNSNSDANPWSAKSSCFELYNGLDETTIDAGLIYLPYSSCETALPAYTPVLVGQPVAVSVAGYGQDATLSISHTGNTNTALNKNYLSQTLTNQGTNWALKTWSTTFTPGSPITYTIIGGVDGFTDRLEYYQTVTSNQAYRVIGEGQRCAVSQANMGPQTTSLTTINQIATIPAPISYCTGGQADLPYAATTNQPPKMLIKVPACASTLVATADYNLMCDNVTDMTPAECKELVKLYDATEGWVQCATENNFCSFAGTRQVRYGNGGAYKYLNGTNGISCNNVTFGDPLSGAGKQCRYKSDAGTWTNESKWRFIGDSTPRTACDWFGITCAGTKVLSINLPSNNLQKTITGVNWTIFSGLTNLELYSNNLGGGLPDVSGMSALTTLRLGYNNFTGTLPSAWGSAASLTEINLADAGLFTGTIPSWTGLSTKLTKLHLGSIMSLTGQAIPSWISQMTKLTELYLYDNGFAGELTGQFNTLTGLQTLQLQSNSLYGNLQSTQLTKLTALYTSAYGGNKSAISDNCLYTGTVSGTTGSFLDARFSFSSLPVTNWRTQRYCDTDLELSTINKAGNLMTGLSMTYTINYKNLGSIPAYEPKLSISLHSGLYLMSGTANLATGSRPYIVSLPQLLPGQTGQYSFTINKMGLGSGFYSIVNQFSIADSYITDTNLVNNNFTDTDNARGSSYAVCINPAITIQTYECESLGDLYTSTNGSSWTTKTNWLSNPDVSTWFGILLTSLSGTNYVQKICMATATNGTACQDNWVAGTVGNNLSGSLPFTLGDLSQLTQFRAPANKIAGVIPAAFGNLDKVTHLVLHGNQITSIGTGISGMAELVWLQIGNNPLTVIDASIANTPKLSTLAFESTNITALPDLTNLCDTLTALSIHQNSSLSSVIPSWFAGCTKLQTLNAYSAGLTGTITNQFTMPSLQYLRINDNNLNGSLPTSLSTGLIELTLQNNKFTGTLPTQWSSITNLQTLNLSNNTGISSTLPTQWSTVNKLKIINLSGATIQGQIPTSWSTMTGMSEFTIPNTLLDGPLPIATLQAWPSLKTPITSTINNNCLYTGLLTTPQVSWMNTFFTWQTQRKCDADLQITLASKSAPDYNPGKTITYTLDYANNGPRWSYEPVINVVLNTGIFLSDTTSTTTGIALPMLAPGQTGKVTITANKRGTGQGTGLYINTFVIGDEKTIDAEDITGLVGHWTLDGNANDVEGGRSSIVTNAILASDRFGYANKAYQFNGNGKIATTHPLANGNTSFSASLWFYVGSAQTRGELFIIGTPSPANQGIMFSVRTNGSVYMDYASNSGPNTTTQVKYGQWNQLIVTKSGDSITMTLNGTTNTFTKALLNIQNNTLLMGDYGANLAYFSGKIADFRLYDRALTSTEVSQLVSGGNNNIITDTGVIRWFKYNECIDVTDVPQPECEALMDIYTYAGGSGWTTKTNWAMIGDTSEDTVCDWYGVSCSGVPETQAPATTAGLSQGLVYRYRDLNVSLPYFLGFGMPPLEPIAPDKTGITSNAQNTNYLAIIGSDVDSHVVTWDGYINIPTAGSYTFYTYSDDNSRVYIDGNIVVQELGCCSEKTGSPVMLSAGLHTFRAEQQEGGGGNYINIKWSGPGISKDYIPDSVMYYNPNLQPQKRVVGLWLNSNGKSYLQSRGGSNNLVGQIPTSIGDFSYLNGLDMQGANFNNTNIPSTFANLSNLNIFRCESCRLTGSLLPEMGALSNLRALYLGNNYLNGSIPASWSGMVSMETFSLFGNKLSGALPSWISVWPRINYIHLAINNFSGLLPDSWATRNTIRTIYLQSNKTLNGSLPDSWKAMNFVTTLQLHDNAFTGPLPVSWSGMTTMSSLYLYLNQLTGSLPSSRSGMVKISDLRLNNNNFSGTTLPDSWSALTGLTYLDLGGAQLGGRLPSSRGALNKLQTLRINSNKFLDDVPTTWFTGMTAMRNFIAYDNDLGGPIDVATRQNWGNLSTNGSDSVISNNCLYTGSVVGGYLTWMDTYFGAQQIKPASSWAPQYYWKNQRRCPADLQLTGLVVTGNLYTGAFMTYTFNYQNNGVSWAYNPTVSVVLHSGLELLSGGRSTSISLGYLRPYASGQIVIPIKKTGVGSGTEIFTNTFAISDTASDDNIPANNIITHTGIVKRFKYPICGIVQDISQVECEALGDFYTSFNGASWTNKTNWMGIGDTTDTTACDWFGVTCVADNSGSAPKTVDILCMGNPTTLGICNMGSWSNGGLAGNNLSGSLPASIVDFSSIRQLSVAGNSKVIGQLPSDIGNLKKLEYLYFTYGPKLTGQLPASMSGLVSLRSLGLIDNKTFGPLPDGLLDLPQLGLVWLNNNQLTGSLPTSSASPLSDFYLPSNPSLSGPIPSWIGTKTTFSWLRIGGTALSGVLPTLAASSLGHIDMSSMPNLTGPLPSSWSGLTNLNTIRLQGNPGLTGSLPSSWSSLTNLVEINLAGSNIQSTLPSSWSSLTKLTSLRLDNNNLQGEIPSSWSALNKLTYITLANNNIDGVIPTWLPTSYTGLINNGSTINNNCMYTGFVTGTFLTYMNTEFGSNWQTQKTCATDPMLVGATTAGSLQTSNTVTYTVNYMNNGPRWLYLPKITVTLYSGLAIGTTTGTVVSQLPSLAPGQSGYIAYTINKNYFTQTGLVSYTNTYTISDATISDTNTSNNTLTQVGIARGSQYPICRNSTLTITQGECESLMDFYTANGGTSWTNSANRGVNPDVSTWFGVTTNGSNVTKINLSNSSNKTLSCDTVSSGNNLSGTLTTSIGGLTSLTELCLGNNKITGQLPASISALTGLVTLSLHHNTISSVASMVTGMPLLEKFDLSYNQLSGSISSVTDTLPQLKYLWYNNNQFSTGLSYIVKYNKLQSIRLQNNILLGGVPASWTGMTFVTELNLQNNRLDRDETNSAIIPTSLITWYNNISTRYRDNQSDITAPVISSLGTITTPINAIGFPITFTISENSYASGLYTSGSLSGQTLSGLYISVTGNSLCTTISSDPIINHNGSVTITVYPETDGTYSSCVLTVRDRANNVSNSLAMSTFTYTQPPYRLHLIMGGSGVVVSNNIIQSIKDLSSFGNTITMAGGSPSYQSAVLNNNPAVQFTSSQSLMMPGIFRKQRFDSVNILMVVKPGSTSSNLLLEQSQTGFPVKLTTNSWTVGTTNLAFTMPQGQQSLLVANNNNGSTQQVRINGSVAATVSSSQALQVSGISVTTIGSGLAQGLFAEAIVYTKSLDVASLNYLESYLALKYGITLPGNYTALLANNTVGVVWTANPSYQYQVIGLGRQLSGSLMLDQKLSSAASGDTIMMHTRGTRTNGQYAIAGSNSGALTWTRNVSGFTGYKAVERTWYIKKTGTDPLFDISVSDTSIASFNFAPTIIVSNSSDFSTITSSGVLVKSGDRWISSGVTINDGQYITFAIAQSSMGGRVWLDLNRDGIQSPSEPSIGGVKVKLRQCPTPSQNYTQAWYLNANQSSPSAMLAEQTTTTGLLNYIFADVNPGNYYMTYDWSTAQVSSPSSLTATKNASKLPGSYDGGMFWSDYEQYNGRNANKESTWYGLMSSLSGIVITNIDSDMMSADLSSTFLPQSSKCFALSAGTNQSQIGAGLMWTTSTDLTITQSLSTGQIVNSAGVISSFNMTLNVGNNGSKEAYYTQIVTQLPSYITVTNVTKNGQNVPYVLSGNQLKIYIGTMNAGVSSTYLVSLSYNGLADDGDVLAFSSKITSTTLETNTANNTSASQSIAIVRYAASIGDRVWIDTNRNGIQDDDISSNVGGIIIELRKASDNSLVKTAKTTSSTGAYLFTSIDPGQYYVFVTNLPKGYVFTNTGAGTNTTNDSNINPSTNKSNVFTITNGVDDRTIDIGIMSIDVLNQCSNVQEHKLRLGQSYLNFNDVYVTNSVAGVRLYSVERVWTEKADYNNAVTLPTMTINSNGYWLGSSIQGYIKQSSTAWVLYSSGDPYTPIKKPSARGSTGQMVVSYNYLGCMVNDIIPSYCLQAIRYNSCHTYEITSCGDGVKDQYDTTYVGQNRTAEQCDNGDQNDGASIVNGVKCNPDCTINNNNVADLGVIKSDLMRDICSLPAGSDGVLGLGGSSVGDYASVITGSVSTQANISN